LWSIIFGVVILYIKSLMNTKIIRRRGGGWGRESQRGRGGVPREGSEEGCGREGVNPVRGNQAVVSVGDEGERVTEGGIHGGGRW
jgi:hypothetical protein